MFYKFVFATKVTKLLGLSLFARMLILFKNLYEHFTTITRWQRSLKMEHPFALLDYQCKKNEETWLIVHVACTIGAFCVMRDMKRDEQARGTSDYPLSFQSYSLLMACASRSHIAKASVVQAHAVYCFTLSFSHKSRKCNKYTKGIQYTVLNFNHGKLNRLQS